MKKILITILILIGVLTGFSLFYSWLPCKMIKEHFPQAECKLGFFKCECSVKNSIEIKNSIEKSILNEGDDLLISSFEVSFKENEKGEQEIKEIIFNKGNINERRY